MCDFVVRGVAETGAMDNHRFALLPEVHNPRRAILQPVVLTSNNTRLCDFVLVGGVKDEPHSPRKSIESQAAWVRNRRKHNACKKVTDFVLFGLTDPDSADHCHALLPDNPRRATLQPVVLTSNNSRACDFVLVGGIKLEPLGGPRASTEAQAAWVRNRRRHLPTVSAGPKYPLVVARPGTAQSVDVESATAAAREAAKATVSAPADERTPAEHDAPEKRADTPIPGRRAHRHKVQEPRDGKERRERTSNDSVMSLLS